MHVHPVISESSFSEPLPHVSRCDSSPEHYMLLSPMARKRGELRVHLVAVLALILDVVVEGVDVDHQRFFLRRKPASIVQM